MLWYKSWLETRWRFLIGLALLMLSATGTVLAYPHVVKVLPLVPKLDLHNELGRRIAEAVQLQRTYRGYVWGQWFRQNMSQLCALFAVLLGTGGLLSPGSGGGTLFTLSLPASRNRLLAVRAATGLAELLALAVIPSLILPLLSPSIGQTYGAGDALIHGACAFIAAAVLFSIAFWLSTVFTGLWHPLLIVLSGACVLALLEQFARGLSRYSLFGVMNAEAWFRGDGLPWVSLLACVAVSAALLYGAMRNIASRDF